MPANFFSSATDGVLSSPPSPLKEPNKVRGICHTNGGTAPPRRRWGYWLEPSFSDFHAAKAMPQAGMAPPATTMFSHSSPRPSSSPSLWPFDHDLCPLQTFEAV